MSSSENSPSDSTTAPASENSADDPTTVSAPKSSPDDSAPKSPTDHSSAAGADDSSDTQTPSKPNIEEDSGDRLEAFIANAIDQVTESKHRLLNALFSVGNRSRLSDNTGSPDLV